MHYILLCVPIHRYCVVGVEVLAFVTLIGVAKKLQCREQQSAV